ncbi:ubiquinol oxidase subunit II [Lichenihabitans sp. Uapishka_5]|uniref:ubiquinol oxidase subunit II n=1 Tax=Lichenihabitans sp. Uapishka_5 TaxID=3037302 RepID=UPI0029E7DD18|nr:ubiquinol oxidase subunit II [Lichenihabitans sp. Uapishka_5]MDX7950889.1 ubiquinol oxidase subunit II [Lichenihabitans sp. Uapishka_5]
MVRFVVRVLRAFAVLPLLLLLGGCDWAIISPAGDVAVQQRNLIYASTGLMLLIIVPVILATLIFAWRYRAANTTAKYDPDWHHSTQLEVLIWTAPLLIIIALGALTWISTHVLDPFRALGRIDASHPITRETQPLVVEAVALDWKWLFFYPEQGIATVNELVAPVDQPITFKITSATVMTSFFVPAMAGQIYAMAGMETQLHAVMNKPGTFQGLAAHYTGAGFSHMNFKMHSLAPSDFNAWVEKVRKEGTGLDRATYMNLAKPSEQEPIHYYGWAERGLYQDILNLCAQPGKMCQSEMMMIDANGGGGKNSEANYDRLKYDGAMTEEGHEAPGATFPASGRPPNSNVQPEGMKPRPLSPEVNGQKSQGDDGQGHNMQGMPGMTDGKIAPAQLDKN